MNERTLPLELRKVLVADDDDAIRRVVIKILQRAHFEVESVNDGLEAIEKLREGTNYAAIVLDLMMPRKSGSDVIQYLNENSPWLVDRVILMTANATTLENLGNICAIVPKPFDVRELVSIVTRCAAKVEIS